MIDALKAAGLVAVIRGESYDDGYKKAKTAVDCGIKAIEITFTTPEAVRLIADLKQEFLKTDVLIGAGTVLNFADAAAACRAKADFAVSPGFSLEAADACAVHQVLYIPGVYTPTEVMNAMEHGFSMVKLFPGGLAHLKALKGPFPQVDFMVTGGVTKETIKDFMTAGAVCIGAGSNLFPKTGAKEEINAWLKAIK